MRVIDFHTHAFPDQLAAEALSRLQEHSGDYRAHHDGTIRGLLASMDRAGIEKAVVVSIATKPKQVPRITDWAINIQGERIIPFASLHPGYQRFREELDRMKEAGLRGIKLHPMYQNFAIDDPELFPLYRAIADRGLICLFHAGNDIAFPANDQASPYRLGRVLDAVPGLIAVAAHLGGWTAWREVANSLLGRNVYLETSFALGEADSGDLRKILENHPPEFFLFGTDAPWLDQKNELERWTALDIPKVFKEKILFKNAERLLNL